VEVRYHSGRMPSRRRSCSFSCFSFARRALFAAARGAAGALLLLAALTEGVAGAAPGPAPAAIYVSAEDSGEVVVIDPDRGEVTARIAVGKRPRGMKLSRDGRQLYVALSGSARGGPGVDESKLPPPDRGADGVGLVDLQARKLVKVFESGQDPESFDLSRDGKLLYISNEETAEMSVLDLGSGKIVRRVPVGDEPEGVTLRPDGRVVYVTSEQQSQLVAVDTRTLTVSARIDTGLRPRSVVFTRDGAFGFVTCENAAEVTVVDTAGKKAVAHIKIEPVAKTVLGPRPMGAALSSDGKHIYVSNGRGESVAVIDARSRKVVKLIDGVGARPWGIAASADGKRLFTANGPSNDVSVIDIAAGTVEKRIKVAGLPWGLVAAPAPATRAAR
jgi:YVTN family beta-propeller protein